MTTSGGIRVEIIPCRETNYAYLVSCGATGKTVLVDAPEIAPVLEATKGRTLEAVWSTHHHHDHVEANEALVGERGVERVFGHASDAGRIPAQTDLLEGGDRFELGELTVDILHVPGHTTGAIAYFVQAKNGEKAVFVGDTLFAAGCGRLFEGTPPMMLASLDKLAGLPEDTRVYAGHEYTEQNLRFAKTVEPNSPAVDEALDDARRARERGEPTLPSTIAREKATNPFLRVDVPEIRNSVGLGSGAERAAVFAELRARKDVF